MNVNHNNGKLGDTLLIEPALAAFGEHHRCVSKLYVIPKFRFLFEGHPYIELVSEPFVAPDWTPDPMGAFLWAMPKNMPFASGYFPQIRLDPRGWRQHFRRFKNATWAE